MEPKRGLRDRGADSVRVGASGRRDAMAAGRTRVAAREGRAGAAGEREAGAGRGRG